MYLSEHRPAHLDDLRRPAAEIVDLVAPFLQATGEQQEYGTVIRRSATHLQGLIDDLIVEAGAGSPLGGIKPEPVWLKPGQVMHLGIEGLGEQQQTVHAWDAALIDG